MVERPSDVIGVARRADRLAQLRVGVVGEEPEPQVEGAERVNVDRDHRDPAAEHRARARTRRPHGAGAQRVPSLDEVPVLQLPAERTKNGGTPIVRESAKAGMWNE